MLYRSLLPIFISTGLLFIAHGLFGILVPVRAEIEGFSPTAIGAIATGFAVGFTAGCFLVPRIVLKVGHIRAFAAMGSLLAAAILLSALLVHPLFWFVVRSIFGFGIAGTLMIVESWLNERTPNADRGGVFSIYMVITQLGLLGGQFALTIDTPESTTLFILAGLLLSTAILPTVLTGVQSPAPLSSVNIDLGKLYANSPVAVVGALSAGVIAGAWTSFAPVYGAQLNFSTSTIAIMMSTALVGGIVFQYPIGKLSDFTDRRYVMVGCALVGVLGGFAVSLTGGAGLENSPLFLLCIFIFGSVLFSIYALFVAHANDVADASEFVMTSSGLLIVYGIGTMAGPLMTAVFLESLGAQGLFYATMLGHGTIAIFTLYRIVVRTELPVEERSDFQGVGLARANTPQTYENDPRAEEDQIL